MFAAISCGLRMPAAAGWTMLACVGMRGSGSAVGASIACIPFGSSGDCMCWDSRIIALEAGGRFGAFLSGPVTCSSAMAFSGGIMTFPVERSGCVYTGSESLRCFACKPVGIGVGIIDATGGAMEPGIGATWPAGMRNISVLKV